VWRALCFLLFLFLRDNPNRHCQRSEYRHRGDPSQHSEFHVASF